MVSHKRDNISYPMNDLQRTRNFCKSWPYTFWNPQYLCMSSRNSQGNLTRAQTSVKINKVHEWLNYVAIGYTAPPPLSLAKLGLCLFCMLIH
jgi:hypothetical protein